MIATFLTDNSHISSAYYHLWQVVLHESGCTSLLAYAQGIMVVFMMVLQYSHLNVLSIPTCSSDAIAK